MSGAWSDHVDELLYEGERERRRVDLEAATVVVTNHRVLAFADGGGTNYRHVDRPNVRRVTVETDGRPRYLVWATALLTLGIGLLAATTRVEPGGLVESVGLEGGDPTGVADGALETVETLLVAFELAVLAGGLLALAVAALYFVRYGRSRSRRLVLRVSGDEDIALPVTDLDLERGRVTELEAAIRPGSGPERAPEPARAGGASTAGTTPTADRDESG